MSRVIELFHEICRIPHCSHQTDEMREYLLEKIKQCQLDYQVDQAGNIVARKGRPTICLQAHYDMVCIGEAAHGVEVVEENGYLSARDSSLGADNGIGVAYMLALMEEGKELEYLFTNDEEVGLVGAKELELEIVSRYLINTDSEKDDDISIGCAGGYDIQAELPLQYGTLLDDVLCYVVNTKDLPGGHSGIDIHRGIPNAIVELAWQLDRMGGKVVSFKGGEKINSIPVQARAIIADPDSLDIDEKMFHLRPTDKEKSYITNFRQLANILVSSPQGVMGYNEDYMSVDDSLNLSMVETVENRAVIQMMGRSNTNEKLLRSRNKVERFMQLAGCQNIQISGEYPAWNPEKNRLTTITQEVMQEHLGQVELKVIHAGFECGILKEKIPYAEMVSIGPNIHHPHSRSERVEVESIHRIYQVIVELIKRLENQ